MIEILRRIAAKTVWALMRIVQGIAAPHQSLSNAWRQTKRMIFIIITLGLFMVMQLAIAKSIIQGRYVFSGSVIVFVIFFVMVAARPKLALLAWFIISPIANLFVPNQFKYTENNSFDFYALFAIAFILIVSGG